jgi:hypothetical protein
MNEKSTSESSLDLTLTQHLREKNFKLRRMNVRVKVDPPRTWYYCIFSNFRTLVILLQGDLASGDELEIVCEGGYKIEDTFIFTWSSIPGVEHYR